MSGFDCMEWSTEEEWNKYIDSLDDVLLFDNIKVTGDKLDIMSTVNDIRTKVIKVLVENDNIKQEHCIELSDIHEQIKFQAFCVETFFNGPELKDQDELELVKPICVICNTDGSINLANDAYIEATGIKELSDTGKLNKYIEDGTLDISLIRGQKYLDILKILSSEYIDVELGEFDDKGIPTGMKIKARISKLFNEIYDEKNNYYIVKNLELLRDGPGYKRNFAMKVTGVKYHWTTLNNKNFPGNIRTAVEYDPKSPIFRQRFDQKGLGFYPFGMYINAYKYNQKVKEILLDGKADEDFNNYFTKLREIASIGDTLIDSSNYLVRGFDGKRHYFNREFFKNTPSHITLKKGEAINLDGENYFSTEGGEIISFTPQILMQSLIDGTFLDRVYGKTDSNDFNCEQIEDIKAHFKSLLKQQSYSYPFSPKNKVGGRNNIEYVTTRYDGIAGKNTIDLTSLGVFYYNGLFYQKIRKANKSSELLTDGTEKMDTKDTTEVSGIDYIPNEDDNTFIDPIKAPGVTEYKLKTFGIGKYLTSD